MQAPVRFANFELDVAGFELRRQGQRVEVQPLVLTLLAYLAAHPDRLLSKEELVQAVWQGRDTSDEVIARAVMKARRALGEDARAPVHIVTEPGKGVRFQCAVACPAAAPSAPALPAPTESQAPAIAWGVLPLVNRSEDTALAWATTGLQRLLCHVMESSNPGLAVSAEPASSVLGSDTGTPSSRVMRALAARPEQRWLAAEFDHTSNGYRLVLAWAGPDEALAAASFVDRDLPELVVAAAGQLLPPAPWQRELARSHPQAWAQLHEAIAHIPRHPRAVALRKLSHCFNRLPRQPNLLIQHSWLLMHLLAPAEAEEAALEALRALETQAPQDPAALFAARVVLSRATVQRGDLELARHRLADCQQLLEQHSEQIRDSVAVAQMWRSVAYLYRTAGDVVAAARAHESSVEHAVTSGVTKLELLCRTEQGYTLSLNGQTRRSEEILRAQAQHAFEVGEVGHAASTMMYLADAMLDRGRPQQACYWAQRGLALALAYGGNQTQVGACRVLLAPCLVALGRLDEAEQVLSWLMRAQVSDHARAELGNQEIVAWMRWRQGRLAEAEDCYRKILADPRLAGWQLWAKDLRSEQATLFALQGRTEACRVSLAALGHGPLPFEAGRAQAALALAEGRPDDARQVLSQLAPQATLGKPDAHRIVLDLGWLSLEAGDVAAAEELLQRAIEMEVETVERDWLTLALQDRLRPVELPAWDALRTRSPSLIRHCPWLGTLGDVQARRAGRAMPLPNLLSVLAW